MQELISILLKWSKQIVIATVLGGFLGVIVALYMTEYFTATSTFLPANPQYMERANLYDITAEREPTFMFGGGSDINRVISLSESSNLEDYLIEKYNLYKHYEIDINSPQKYFMVLENLHTYFKMIKTPLGMLQAEVTDENPAFAATMANDIVKQLDSLNKKVITEKKRDVQAVYKKELTEKEQTMKILTDSLKKIVRTNPSDTITTGILNKMTQKAVDNYINLLTIDDQYKSTFEDNYSSFYIIEPAIPPVKRSKPIRWLVVVSTALIVFAGACLSSIIIEKFKEYKF